MELSITADDESVRYLGFVQEDLAGNDTQGRTDDKETGNDRNDGYINDNERWLSEHAENVEVDVKWSDCETSAHNRETI